MKNQVVESYKKSREEDRLTTNNARGDELVGAYIFEQNYITDIVDMLVRKASHF